MNVLSLFSGIGGLELGMERAGMTVVGQVEIDPFCQQVLAKHWPEVPRHDDVRTTVEWWQSESRPAVHLVAGGFPCQPFSTAGQKRGTADERWGWPWYYDVVRALRPRYIVVENVAALLRDADAFGWILADLAEGGYDAEWDCVPAASVGAPHIRDRLFLVAYAAGDRRRPGGAWRSAGDGSDRQGFAAQDLADAYRKPVVWTSVARPERAAWPAEPEVGRVADGVPTRVVRPQLRALGNAVVPQVAERIGRLIVAADLAGAVP